MTYNIRPLKFNPCEIYDLLIYAVGYEERSRYISSLITNCQERLAFPFQDNRFLNFQSNLQRAKQIGASIIEVATDIEFRASVRTALEVVSTRSASTPARVAIDISSFSRPRIAGIVSAVAAILHERRLEVDFLYAPALFTGSDSIPKSSILTAAPISGRFRGRLRSMSLPPGAVFGLGYEPQRAVGAFELLEPVSAWAFVPVRSDPAYNIAVQDANAPLLRSLPDSRVFYYEVAKPAQLYYDLDSFSFSLQHSYRLAIVPMGPKIFALCALLVAASDWDQRPAVWRVGERVRSEPLDVIPAGPVVGLTWRQALHTVGAEGGHLSVSGGVES